MAALETLVRAYYQYVLTRSVRRRYVEGASHVVAPLVTSVAAYVTSMFKVFGLIDPEVSIGFAQASGSVDEETVLTPVVNILSEFRTKGGDSAGV